MQKVGARGEPSQNRSHRVGLHPAGIGVGGNHARKALREQCLPTAGREYWVIMKKINGTELKENGTRV